MGYRKIPNLYKDTSILHLCKEVYALEKIHGTSTHLAFKDGELRIFSGGIKSDLFASIFDLPMLTREMTAVMLDLQLGPSVTVYGEGYGGKCQGMSDTYGKDTKFVAFEVKAGETWLTVPEAAEVVKRLGLEFVDYVLIPTELSKIDAERDRDSVQAIRNGCGPGKMREGVILRPTIEIKDGRGERVMVKHKRAEFGETKTPREVDPSKAAEMTDANEIAEEWVTEMRLAHVLDKLLGPEAPDIKRTGDVCKAMVADVLAESTGEFVPTPLIMRAIGTRAAQLFKQILFRIPT